ncbi:histidine kinase [Spirosoma pollinicola]|uniref:histidine kinase n=2 Tax=Spirosoma pollinicola TaxID=2057025 RepID=A0A2K8ZCM6_9BACT|nr:histidine kinase [Spirosoma pollinicola]
MLTIRQFGRSEVFLDGQRLAILKPVHYDSGGSQRVVALLPIRIADTNQHTLAVRYAFRPDLLIGTVIDKDPFRLDIDPWDQAGLKLLDQEQIAAGLSGLLVGVFGLLSLLHWLFYRANPAQAVHRVLSATMLAFTLTFLTDYAEHYIGTLTLDSLRGALSQLGINAAFALLLLAVYTYLDRRPGWVFWSLVVVQMGSAGYAVVVARLPDNLVWVPFVGVLIDYIRVSWLAKRHVPDPDARLPWNSLRVTLLALVAVVPMAILMSLLVRQFKLGAGQDWVIIPVLMLFLLALFSIPIGLSLSLVRDYARTYRTLQDKLCQVDQLSTQALIQEQEKQLLLTRQNDELERQVTERTAELTHSLTTLRTTQQQLIQKEKMASLGELTAGIAHEIQNPLNFVNNFSEVSDELVDELQAQQHRLVPDRALETELLDDLKQNLQKITQHGKRASAIVKGMLEHSRSSQGNREWVDINVLAKEYFQIAYQGQRAKDKDFTAELTTNFGAALPRLEVIPQEIGRVLLNLYTNAFYAVRQKQKTAVTDYTPRITLETCLMDGHTQIRVGDNGTGMAESVKAKIFQPFFTTKPTGEGTGLGLSLSYDIVTQGHGGLLLVESQVGNGSKFIIELPNASMSIS